MARMKTLADHNKERWNTHVASMSSTPVKNGIECPNCRAELFDSDPMSTLTVCPPQKKVHCEACSFSSTRLV